MVYRYKMNGFNIILDVNSGGIHVVDDIVYDVLDFDINQRQVIVDALEHKYKREYISEAIDEIFELKKQELLFTEDTYEEVLPQVDQRNPVVKALCLHIAHDCNLKCQYCFAEEGEYKGKRSLMSFEVGKAAIDFIIEKSANRKNLEIDFFGGEPLMNLSVVKQIVTYASEKEKQHNKIFRFTLTTNGVLLNEETEAYINEHMHNVVLSLDGRKEVNDTMRMTVSGKGSYEIIVPKFQRLAESRNQNNYYVRGTFTAENLDFSKDVLHMADLGFQQVSIEPVVAADDAPYAIKTEHLERIFAEYEALAVQLLQRQKEGRPFQFFHFMIDLTGGPCVAKRLVGCGAGTEYLAVTPEGDLFPCHQFVGIEAFKMGDVYNGVSNLEKRKEFERCNVYAKEECRGCFAKFYCSGGCAANAYNANGDILKPYKIGCDMQRKRTECSIMMKVAENACTYS